MARSRARRLLPLLTFVTLGMVLGSLLQLAFFRRLDEDDHSHSVHLDHDQEAAVLRLGHVKPEVISWKPRIIVFHNFLSSEECDYLRDIARPRLEISTVVDVATGKGVKSDVRTSSGMFVNSEERKLPVIQVSSRYLRLAREHKHGKRYLRLAREHKHGKCMNDESGNDLHHSIILNSGGEIVELIPEKYI